MNNGKDYNYSRGAWVMKHPPPLEGNTTLLWSKVYVKSLIINIPPPNVVQSPMIKNYNGYYKRL